MKKFWAVLLAAVLVFGLSACIDITVPGDTKSEDQVTTKAPEKDESVTAAPEHKLNQDGKVILWINPEKPDDYRLPEEELCVMLLAVIAGGVIGVIGALLLAAA